MAYYDVKNKSIELSKEDKEIFKEASFRAGLGRNDKRKSPVAESIIGWILTGKINEE